MCFTFFINLSAVPFAPCRCLAPYDFIADANYLITNALPPDFQKAVFCIVKDGLLPCEMPPFIS